MQILSSHLHPAITAMCQMSTHKHTGSPWGRLPLLLSLCIFVSFYFSPCLFCLTLITLDFIFVSFIFSELLNFIRKNSNGNKRINIAHAWRKKDFIFSRWVSVPPGCSLLPPAHSTHCYIILFSWMSRFSAFHLIILYLEKHFQTPTAYKIDVQALWSRIQESQWSQNQIDYILCSRRWRNSVQSAKTRPGVDCNSDHEFFVAKFRLRLKKVGKGHSGKT